VFLCDCVFPAITATLLPDIYSFHEHQHAGKGLVWLGFFLSFFPILMLYFIAQIWDLRFGDLREEFPLFCYLFPEAPSFCAGIWSSWTCVTAAGDAARRFYICIYCSALLFNFALLFLAQRRSDANEGWITRAAGERTLTTPKAEAWGAGGRWAASLRRRRKRGYGRDASRTYRSPVSHLSLC